MIVAHLHMSFYRRLHARELIVSNHMDEDTDGPLHIGAARRNKAQELRRLAPVLQLALRVHDLPEVTEQVRCSKRSRLIPPRYNHIIAQFSVEAIDDVSKKWDRRGKGGQHRSEKVGTTSVRGIRNLGMPQEEDRGSKELYKLQKLPDFPSPHCFDPWLCSRRPWFDIGELFHEKRMNWLDDIVSNLFPK